MTKQKLQLERQIEGALIPSQMTDEEKFDYVSKIVKCNKHEGIPDCIKNEILTRWPVGIQQGKGPLAQFLTANWGQYCCSYKATKFLRFLRNFHQHPPCPPGTMYDFADAARELDDHFPDLISRLYYFFEGVDK
jgi:hypothetical protein